MNLPIYDDIIDYKFLTESSTYFDFNNKLLNNSIKKIKKK